MHLKKHEHLRVSNLFSWHLPVISFLLDANIAAVLYIKLFIISLFDAGEPISNPEWKGYISFSNQFIESSLLDCNTLL